jgi:hypothetical protein
MNVTAVFPLRQRPYPAVATHTVGVADRRTDVTAPVGDVSMLVVDDQRLDRAGFKVILDLEPEITVVGEACDGREAITLAARLRLAVG